LARAIREDDPVRARKLLEETRRDDRGGATPPLAEMLIAGEGGPANPEVRVQYPNTVLYYAAEAAELDKPGGDSRTDRPETLTEYSVPGPGRSL
jgi:hypothetical protein